VTRKMETVLEAAVFAKGNEQALATA